MSGQKEINKARRNGIFHSTAKVRYLESLLLHDEFRCDGWRADTKPQGEAGHGAINEGFAAVGYRSRCCISRRLQSFELERAYSPLLHVPVSTDTRSNNS